jgi:hypothetical protein
LSTYRKGVLKRKEGLLKLPKMKNRLLSLSKSDELKEDTRVADPDPDPDPYWIRIQSGQ